MRIIKINSFCYIKYIHGMYMLIDRQTLRVIARAFDLEQLASELIKNYYNYLSDSDEIDLLELIKLIKELKNEMRGIEIIAGDKL